MVGAAVAVVEAEVTDTHELEGGCGLDGAVLTQCVERLRINSTAARRSRQASEEDSIYAYRAANIVEKMLAAARVADPSDGDALYAVLQEEFKKENASLKKLAGQTGDERWDWIDGPWPWEGKV